jgi:hypothetical protein
MNRTKQHWLGFVFAAALLAAISLDAAETQTAEKRIFQVTGTVVEVTANKITVQKGNEKWAMIRNSQTKLKGDPKIGDKVTVFYSMVANVIEVKEPDAKK